MPAFRVHRALAAPAPGQRVTHVSGQARAHGTLLARVVVSGLAPGVLAARIRLAKVSWLERPATDERIARHGPWTAAYRRRAPSLAVGVHAAHAARARVNALLAQARRTVGRTIAVRQTLGPTRHVRVSEVALQSSP